MIIKLKINDDNFNQGVEKFVRRYNKLNGRDSEQNVTANCVIPRIASALHTFAMTQSYTSHLATKKRLGKRIKVQATAVGRRRKELTRGAKKARQGRPPGTGLKRKLNVDDQDSISECDDFDRSVFRVRKRPKVPKRKHALAENIAKNQQNSGKW